MGKIFNHLSLLFIFCTLSVSCSSIRFTSKGKIPITLERLDIHQKELIFKGSKKFYLWGLIPDEHIVYLDQVAYNEGFDELSGVTIKESRNTSDMLIGIISFGLYLPVEYTITAFTREEDDI